MKRGEIYYIHSTHTVGAEIETKKARPAVIVSNNSLNHHSGVVEVVFLTTQPKKDMATHVVIGATGIGSTALCEQINSVAVERVGDYAGTCTVEEMASIDQALLASLDIVEQKGSEQKDVKVAEPSKREKVLLEELERAITERDRYAKMLDVMLTVTEV